MAARPIIIDTDPGVDDAIAILMALASPELEVLGRTTIFGNAATAITTRNALAILEAVGRSDIPVAGGELKPIRSDYLGPVPHVHGQSGLGAAKLKTPAGSAIDQWAADLVFGADWSVTMVGLDVTHQVNLPGAAIDRITGAPTAGARLLAEALPVYREFFEVTNRIDGIYVHDPSAVAYLLEPDAFSSMSWPLRVETESLSRGKTWPNLGGTDEETPTPWQQRPLVNVCTSVDDRRVLELVEARLAISR